MKPIRALLTVAISLVLIRDGQAKDTLADGLVAYYPFNGNANDESGNGWDGVGSPIPTEDRFGQPDSAYAFSELSHYILIPGSEGLHLESALSFSVWFKSTYTGPDENFMLGKHRSGFRNGHFINANQGTEELGVSVGDTNHHTVSILDLSLFDGSWHHLACTYDGWTAQLYMDGSLCDTGTERRSPTNDVPWIIGTHPNALQGSWVTFWHGSLDDIRIYDRALSEDEVLQLYEDSGKEDCNGNSVPDSKDIREGTSQDCNRNRVPDECDLSQGTSRDCNGNGIPDECDLGVDLGFAPETDIPSPPSPGNPVAVAAGDFSSDGTPDLALASGGGNNITVLLRLESGEFFPEPPLVLDNPPTFLVTAELNGDGRLDLVASTKGTQDNLRVFLGSGSATFPWASKYTVPSGARCIAPADLDGDGDTDLAVASEKELQVAVLLNAGDGTFSQSTFEVDEAPSWITAADFTGDGKPDLAALRGTTGTLAVLKNLGDGTFEPGLPVQAGSSTSLPRAMAAGDWDGDGNQDLVVALEGTSALALLANAGGGTFAAPKNLSLAAAPIFVASRDLDFDGRPDLATVSSAASKAAVLRNTGALAFKEMGPFTVGKGASFLALADLVGSAAPDLLVVNSGSDSLSVVRNTSSPALDKDCDSNGVLDSCDIASGAAKDCNSNGIPDACDIASGALVDANKDGIPDSCQGGGTRYLRADANSDGKGDIADAIFALVYLFSGGPKPGCLDAADITDDGKVDITDPIFFLAYLFAGGLRPADPFGACGADPTEDALGCENFRLCP